MPNHITNIINIGGDNCSKERILEILEAIKNDEVGIGSIDFNKIIPTPDDIFQGNLGADEEAKYGEKTWYKFNTQHWGTKWNAYDFYPFDEGSNQIEFLTAWSAPHPILIKLSEMYPDIQCKHMWADENIGFNVGEREYNNGLTVFENIPCEGSKEAYELAAEIVCVDLKDLNLRLSADGTTYKYFEEIKEKPEAPLIGADGNIFNLMGIASRVLRENDMDEQAKAMCQRIKESGSYEKALAIIGEYVAFGYDKNYDEDCEDLEYEEDIGL